MPILNWFQVGLGATVAFILSYLLHSLDVTLLNAAHQRDLTEQARALDDRCSRTQLITKDANHELSESLLSIDRRLVDDRMQSPACIVLPPASPAHAPSDRGEPPRANGLDSRWLRRYAATCESYRQERMILERFIANTWKANGQ